MAPSNDHVKGKRGRRLEPEIDDFDEFAAAETLVLLANCDADGFCPRSTSRRREFIDIASLPTPHESLTAHPAADAANYGPAVNVEEQVSVSPDTPLKAAEIDGGRHGCLVCGKRFQSPQALGGHMTSHRVIKPQTTTPSGGGNIPSAVRIHECADCHEKFSSGQALGGHKRKHFEQVNAGKVPATTKLKFDLNMPPPEE